MTLLTVCQDASVDLSLPVPDAVISDTDPAVRLLLRTAQEEGRSLAGRHTWQALTTEHTFTTVAAAEQTSSIPSDFDRLIIETMFNRDRNRRVWGPIDSNEWQAYQASLVTRVDPAFRIRGDTILITPTPDASETVAYEYVSKNWCESSGGTGQAAWAADTDTAKLNESAMTLGVVWRWRKAKGLDFSAAERDYERIVADLILRDGSRPRLSCGPVIYERSPVAPWVPDTLVGL
ncbi:MAG: hypothetical protein Q8R92_09735 [Deltaproteobacteria bacterium]|nr:hypothetical protein [Deltaproteobacteria bacterium]